MIGIILGAYTCNYLYVGRLHWIYTKPIGTAPAPCQSKVQTFVNKFKPNVWARYDWSMFNSLKRYGQLLFFCFLCLGIDCMNFFLKFILWVPANHRLLSIRLFIWAFTSIAAAKEYYEFITNRNCKRVGPFTWMGSLSLAVEFSIALKFGHTMFHAPFPWYVNVMWVILWTLLISGAIYSYINGTKKEKTTEKSVDLLEPGIDIELVYAKKNN